MEDADRTVKKCRFQKTTKLEPMPSFTIKGIPDDLFVRLKQRARRHRRSINSEVLMCIEEALAQGPVDVDAALEHIDRLRSRLGGVTPLTDRVLRRARDAGRR